MLSQLILRLLLIVGLAEKMGNYLRSEQAGELKHDWEQLARSPTFRHPSRNTGAFFSPSGSASGGLAGRQRGIAPRLT